MIIINNNFNSYFANFKLINIIRNINIKLFIIILIKGVMLYI